LTAINNDYIFLSIPAETTTCRVYVASIVAAMEDYPDIVGNPILFKVTVLVPEVPKIPNLEFTIGGSIVQFAYDPFLVRPIDFDVGENAIVAYI
jgi:hypothetical protein